MGNSTVRILAASRSTRGMAPRRHPPGRLYDVLRSPVSRIAPHPVARRAARTRARRPAGVHPPDDQSLGCALRRSVALFTRTALCTLIALFTRVTLVTFALAPRVAAPRSARRTSRLAAGIEDRQPHATRRRFNDRQQRLG